MALKVVYVTWKSKTRSKNLKTVKGSFFFLPMIYSTVPILAETQTYATVFLEQVWCNLYCTVHLCCQYCGGGEGGEISRKSHQIRRGYKSPCDELIVILQLSGFLYFSHCYSLSCRKIELIGNIFLVFDWDRFWGIHHESSTTSDPLQIDATMTIHLDFCRLLNILCHASLKIYETYVLENINHPEKVSAIPTPGRLFL